MVVAALGGGKGLEKLVQALKLQDVDFAAVVTTTDNGGSTGKLRRKLGIPAVGDLRRVIDALSPMGFAYTVMEARNTGHPPGNLILAELTLKYGIERAARLYRRLLRVKEAVVPAVVNSCNLVAVADGRLVFGEEKIAETEGIEKLWIEPDPVPARYALKELKKASVAVLGPGSFFTSILPHLAVEELKELLAEVPLIFVMPLSMKEKSVRRFTLDDYLKWFESFGVMPHAVIADRRYHRAPVLQKNVYRGVKVIKENVALDEHFHDPRALGDVLWRVLSHLI